MKRAATGRGASFWRGNSDLQGDAPAPDGRSAGRREAILLAVEAAGNRSQLLRHLEHAHDVMEPKDGEFPGQPFDLAILDAAGLRRWERLLSSAKRDAQPVFLPVMMIIPKPDLNANLGRYWDLADELLVSPVDRRELSQRTEMLLRARRLSLAQRSRLAYLVHHDRATGLPNETLFLDRLKEVVRDAMLLNGRVHVAVVQANMEPVMESIGTRGREEVARSFSARLRRCVGADKMLARLSPDQWAFILRRTESMEDVLKACNRVEELASAPIRVGSEEVYLSLNTGVARHPGDAPDGEGLLDRALAALSQGEEGPGPKFYSADVQRRAIRHIRIEAGLRAALEADGFEQWLQPKVRLKDMTLIGVEALVRWRLPNGELVPPRDFIPVAEATGLIVELDREMVEKACDFIRRSQLNGGTAPKVAVNISAVSLHSAGFVSTVEDAISRSNVAPSMLEIEVTESALMQLSTQNLSKLALLRDQGIRIALDDFGTGYCSLAYLNELPITTLKIDQGFVCKLPDHANSVSITRAITGLGNSLELEVVAEGIETKSQVNFLRSLGVGTGQGFLFARPFPAHDFPQPRSVWPTLIGRGAGPGHGGVRE